MLGKEYHILSSAWEIYDGSDDDTPLNALRKQTMSMFEAHHRGFVWKQRRETIKKKKSTRYGMNFDRRGDESYKEIESISKERRALG